MVHIVETRQLLKNMPDIYRRIEWMIEQIEKKYRVRVAFGDRFGLDSLKLESRLESDPKLARILKPRHYGHNNCFCNYIRTAEGYMRCLESSDHAKMCYLKNKSPLYSSCYMGIEEFRFPIFIGGKLTACVLVGQFTHDMEGSLKKVTKQAEKLGYDPEKCRALYQSAVKVIDFDVKEMEGDVLTLCDILSHYYSARTETGEQKEEQAKKAKRDIVKTATEYINTHYNQNLTLHDVAQKCYCNPNYLSGLFQKKLKLNFLQYLNIVRVNNAKTLLLIRGMPISEIAERVGFTTATGFIKAYKKQEGITPYQSRKQMLS